MCQSSKVGLGAPQETANRVSSKKITVIPYGADLIEHGNKSILEQYNLRPKEYSIIIARPEPENSILEIVRAFSREKRDHTLVILGEYLPGDII